jgi:DNA-binding SARP family transcriptional activator/TolB-like protein
MEIHLLGSLDLVSDEGRRLDVSPGQKRLALLAYLAVATPQGFHRRESLLPLLWPESNETRARGSLNQTVHQLRRMLGPHQLPGRGEDELGLDWSHWRCDVVDFRTALAAGRLEDALALYGGELLPGFGNGLPSEFAEWLEVHRSTLRRAAAAAALELCDRADTEARTRDAVAWLRRASDIEPLDADHVHGVMQRLHRCGAEAAALVEYQSFVQRLAAHDLVPPDLLRTYASSLRASSASLPTPGAAAALHAGSIDHGTPAERSLMPWSRQRAAAAAMLLVVAVAAAGYAVRADGLLPVHSLAARGELDLAREVVLADFTNRTAEEYLAEGITEAFRIDFSESPRIRLAPPAQVQQARRRMNLPAGTRLGPELARELAIREGLEAVITGEVSALGSGYVIAAQLVTAGEGTVLLSRRVTAAGSDDVIPAVDRLSAWLRRRIGESLRDLVDEEPLHAVTTGSLEALKAYSAALQPLDVYSDRSVQLWEQAIALDSTFAAAYRQLGVWLYWRGGERVRVHEVLTRAYELRHRLTQHERLLVEGTYYHYATHDYGRAVTVFEQMLARNPRDYAALDHLELLYGRLRAPDRALEMHRRRAAITSLPLSAALLYAAGRREEAERILRHNLVTDTVTISTFDELVHFRAASGDFVAADSFARLGIERARRSGSSSALYKMMSLQVLIRLMRGHVAEGAALLDAATRLHDPQVRPDRYLDKARRLAEFDVLVGHDPARARARLDSALRHMPLASITSADRPYLDFGAAYALAGDTAAAAHMLHEAGESGMLARARETWRLHLTAAVLHAHRGHEQAAMAQIEDGLRRAMFPRCVLAARGLVHDLLGAVDSAVIAWKAFLLDPAPVLDCYAMFATHARERLAELHSRRGDVASAAACSRELLAFWTDPDPVLRPRRERARQRAALLADTAWLGAPLAQRATCAGPPPGRG